MDGTAQQSYDLHFYFDPVCPFAWMTSKWVRQVADARGYTVDWRFIALRILNERLDYARDFPPGYEAGHTAGLRLLRVAARTRAGHGREAVAKLYTAFGERIFDSPRDPDDDPTIRERRGTRDYVEPILAAAGLPSDLADALEDSSYDDIIRAETEEALSLTGKDVGTPIIHFQPPGGAAFFGPVISRLPSPEESLRLWDHVVGLAGFAGFAELKRSLRERVQLRGLGVEPEDSGVEEDWHGGRRA